ncbi:hypothetical protein, partial [Thiohalocapsa sp.]|uniref:hypothetical protein n=1 Tax=Thiohalocapsa sp. TaxID=2497641 RepID=UPI0025E0AFD6
MAPPRLAGAGDSRTADGWAGLPLRGGPKRLFSVGGSVVRGGGRRSRAGGGGSAVCGWLGAGFGADGGAGAGA